MYGGHIVAVQPAVFVAIFKVLLHIDADESLGTRPAGYALIEGSLVCCRILGQSLSSDQLLGKTSVEPLVVADQEETATGVSDIAGLATRARVAVGARLADALETLAGDAVDFVTCCQGCIVGAQVLAVAPAGGRCQRYRWIHRWRLGRPEPAQRHASRLLL